MYKTCPHTLRLLQNVELFVLRVYCTCTHAVSRGPRTPREGSSDVFYRHPRSNQQRRPVSWPPEAPLNAVPDQGVWGARWTSHHANSLVKKKKKKQRKKKTLSPQARIFYGHVFTQQQGDKVGAGVAHALTLVDLLTHLQTNTPTQTKMQTASG